jgi:hypothetical protein
MPRLLADMGRWCAICALTLLLAPLMLLSWTIGLVNVVVLGVGEWLSEIQLDLIRRHTGGGHG